MAVELKRPLIPSHICLRKNSPNSSQPKISRMANRKAGAMMSQPLSSTTVPSTFSKPGSSLPLRLRSTTPVLTNSPRYCSTKLDILPMLMALKTVSRSTSGNMGSIILRQRKALKKKAQSPAAIDSSTISQRQELRPLRNSFQSTPLKLNHISRAAAASESIYLTLL